MNRFNSFLSEDEDDFLQEYFDAAFPEEDEIDDKIPEVPTDDMIDIIHRAEKQLDVDIREQLVKAVKKTFSVSDLDKPVNDEETLREYITDSEDEFSLPHALLDWMTTEELTAYVDRLDEYWAKVIGGYNA